MKQRMAYIDTAKAAGIFMICLGHFLPASSLPRVAIYSFHVPLFFFIAGLLNAKPISSFRQFLLKEKMLLIRTLIPYTLWFLFSLSYNLVRNNLNVAETVRCFFYLEGLMIWNTPLWFLPCYFLMLTVYRLLYMLTRENRGWLFLCCMAAFGCAVVFDKCSIAVSFLGLDKGIHMLGYILLGGVCSDLVRKEAANRHHAFMYLLLFVAGIFAAVLINGYNNLSPYRLDYNEILFYIPVACVLCFSFLICCSLCKENYVVSLLAKNSCFIMCSHYFPWQLAGILLKSRTIWNGFACTVFLFCVYIGFMVFVDRKIRSPRIRNFLSYVGLQF